jgi:hypothetical protein
MPKLESPFVREDGICTPVIADEYRWVFTEEAVAVDKLDGTNVSILVQHGYIMHMYNRAHRVAPFTHDSTRFYAGVTRAVERGYFVPGEDGQFFGELVGPGTAFAGTLAGRSDKDIYNATSDLFKNLWSIYKNQIRFSGNKDVDENMGFTDCAAEGIVFYGPDGQICKLRRNMFSWFTGKGKRTQ